MRHSSSLVERYSVVPRDQIYVKGGYKFLSFAKKISNNLK